MPSLELEKEPLTEQKSKTVYYSKSKRKSKVVGHFFQVFQRANGWICKSTLNKVISFCLLLLALNTTKNFISIRNSKKKASNAYIKMDVSQIRNMGDLEAISIAVKDRCFPGMAKKCTCPDPMTPKDRQGRRHWLKASNENADRVAQLVDDVDVVFYGDSITEGWLGTSFGFPNGRKDKNEAVFNSLFTPEGGGKYKAIAMGISGDSTSGMYKAIAMGISGDSTTNLLWRLQNGEMPNSLNPKVFWLLIGTNDMGNWWCSPKATLIGILRVVEELRIKKPGTTIVLNSILPRAWDRSGEVMRGKKLPKGRYLPELWTAIQDINDHLEIYSYQHENVHYFDSTDVFFAKEMKDSEKLAIDKNLMPDNLHPSSIGYKLWGDKIVQELDKLIKVQ